MKLILYLLIGFFLIVACSLIWVKYSVYSKEEFRTNKKMWVIIVLLLLLTEVIISCIYAKGYKDLTVINLILGLFIVIMITPIDAKHHIIPNKIILLGIICRLLIIFADMLLSGADAVGIIVGSVVGALIGFGILLFAFFISKGGVGMGDVKLIGMLGLIIGFNGVYNTLFYALILVILVSAVLLLMKKATKKSQLPFGPFICAGYIFTVCMGVF